jgi:lysophospholipase L1-like esterase
MAKARTSFYILIPLAAVIFALMLMELVLAIAYPTPYSMETNMYFEPNPHTGYRIKANSEGSYYNDIRADASSQGLRDREFTLERIPGVPRVMVLGDSFTVGANVEAHEAYAKQLEDILSSESDGEVEVINTGVGGWSAHQYAQYYEYYGRAFDPDLVIVGFFVGNDTYVDRFSGEDMPTATRGRRIRPAAAKKKMTQVKVFLYEYSNIARLAMNIGVATNEDFSRERCDQFTNAYLSIQNDRMPNHRLRTPATDELAKSNIAELMRIKAMTDADGDRLLVVIIPDENQLNPALQQRLIRPEDMQQYDFALPQSMLVSLLEEQGVDALDLQPAFANDPRCLYMNDTHWTPDGHRLAAEKIAEALKLSL